MKDIFRKAMMAMVPANSFDLSHDVKMSFNMGFLIPSCIVDVIPGDVFNMGTENMLRFSPLVSPVMHNVNITTHYFFVPNRILWPEWEDWIIGETTVAPPTIGIENLTEKSLGDYMGLPIGSTINNGNMRVNALPFSAYYKVYDEYYRDQNLQPTEQWEELIAGPNNNLQTKVFGLPLKRAWMHDYFTSALPSAQFGSGVSLPLMQEDEIDVTFDTTNPMELVDASGNNIPSHNVESNPSGQIEANDQVTNQLAWIDPNGSLKVNVNAQATDINTLRRAFRLQEWLEKSMRGGRRYIEQMRAHFGVISKDARLDRPEYIGGSKQKMVISEVLSTAQTVGQGSSDIPVGNLSGHGISLGGGNTWKYKAREHGFIIGIINVQPTTAYSQGLHRMYHRNDNLDYAWPSFANIGEQEVLNQELTMFGGSAFAKGTFGYVPRYSEYKYMNNRIAGEMRTNLNFWHLAREFTAAPVLNSSFIEADPSNRIFADTSTDTDKIYAHIFNNIRVMRKLPKYGIPTI